jgi:predicted glycosyltransferase
MIRAVRGRGGRVVCSLRDILVDARPDQQQHDDRARWLTDRYFDAVLVHSDARFARLEDSFRPARPLRTPVHYTGFVVPERALVSAQRGEHLLVSAGGGIVGAELFRVALQARALLPRPLPMKIIAGPFLPEPAWQVLQRDAAREDGVEVVRHVGDMVAEMRRARASISQCGYNTALDIVVAGVPALVVPYETKTENEQSMRAARLHGLGVLKHLVAAQLNAVALAAAIDALLGFTPRAAVLELDGTERTATIVAQIAHAPECAA